MKLTLAYYGDSVLRKKTDRIEIITDEIRQLVRDMEETMFLHHGVGLAAPQVKQSIALFIINAPEDENTPGITRVFINPKIIEYSEEQEGYPQGCLSIPKVYGNVIRPKEIKIEATDLEGNRFTEVLQGIKAHAFMHENDHLNGILFIDRIKGKERLAMEPLLRQIRRKYQSS